MSNSKNQELYPFLVEADRVGYITWTKSTSESEHKIIRRAISLDFLYEENNSTLRLTEKGQMVVDNNGDFSVLEEKPNVNVVADQGSSVFVGDNSGHINQSSSNKMTNKTPQQTPTIKTILIAVIGSVAGGLILWYLTEYVL